MITIRSEEPADYAAVFEINNRAFPTDAEARLVNGLRDQAKPVVSLVAELDGKAVGHILFSPVTIEGETICHKAMGLGPMAVLPELQRKGIGAKLIRVGLDICRSIGEAIVFVLGHPEYYPRFGFEPAAPKGFRYKSPDYDPFFFVVQLEAGALANISGLVNYHPLFDGVEEKD
jgi:putative acetyltransferase